MTTETIDAVFIIYNRFAVFDCNCMSWTAFGTLTAANTIFDFYNRFGSGDLFNKGL